MKAEAVKFVWKRKHVAEKSWKQTHGARMWKRLKFCGSESTLKKEAGSGSK